MGRFARKYNISLPTCNWAGGSCGRIDVRLTADFVPIVYHYYYLEYEITLSGPVFKCTAKQIRESATILDDGWSSSERISTLNKFLGAIGGQIRLEIEIKGTEHEAV